MILLGDSLLPFENFNGLPLVIPRDSVRGIRDLEEPRKLFLVHCLTGSIQHIAMVDLAKRLTARHLSLGGYGFQCSQGLFLPAFLSGSKSLYLLRYHPARLYDLEPEVLFDYEHEEYIDAPRTELPASESILQDGNWNLPSLLGVKAQVVDSSLAINDGNDALRRVIKLRLILHSGKSVSIDLGQIARGRRYAYEVRSDKRSAKQTSPTPRSSLSLPDTKIIHKTVLHDAVDILSQPGLVISPRAKNGHGNTIHVIPTTDPILKLALLGKFYPENVILSRENDTIDACRKAGKGFAERLIILDQNDQKALG
jgi:hypothetical protein